MKSPTAHQVSCVADLAALVREAALRAAARASEDGKPPALTQDDLTGALSVIRPLSRSATEEVSVGSVTLDDVGDMADTKQALTEAVLWPLQHPDTFAAPRCRAAARRAAVRAAGLREDVRGARAGQLGPAVACTRSRAPS